jgi:hypothetical protein
MDIKKRKGRGIADPAFLKKSRSYQKVISK